MAWTADRRQVERAVMARLTGEYKPVRGDRVKIKDSPAIHDLYFAYIGMELEVAETETMCGGSVWLSDPDRRMSPILIRVKHLELLV